MCVGELRLKQDRWRRKINEEISKQDPGEVVPSYGPRVTWGDILRGDPTRVSLIEDRLRRAPNFDG